MYKLKQLSAQSKLEKKNRLAIIDAGGDLDKIREIRESANAQKMIFSKLSKAMGKGDGADMLLGSQSDKGSNKSGSNEPTPEAQQPAPPQMNLGGLFAKMVVKKPEPAVNDIGLDEEIVEERKEIVKEDKQNTEEQQHPKPPPDMKLLLGLLQKQKPTGFETI